MSATRIESDASDLLIAIGGNIEKWILNNARANAERRTSGADQSATVGIDDIRESFEAFVAHGMGDIKRSISDVNRPRPTASLRAG